MNMKVEETLTCKKGIVLYFSATGNTKAIVDMFDEKKYDVINVRYAKDIDLSEYNVVVLGMSTWSRGLHPNPFINIKEKIFSLKGKIIGIFGSGRSEFEFFCGAVDLMEEVTKENNIIAFTYKYEGYPKDVDFNNMKENINKINMLGEM